MRLILVRHGETESNRLGLALGRADVPLNERGRWQAERLALALASEPLVAVYSSPLARALETAQAIAEVHSLDVQVEAGLIEMDIGQAEGLTFSEMRERFPGLLEVWAGPEGPFQPLPGGERLVDVQQRAWDAVGRIAARHPGEVACAVTHNFVILTVLATVMKISLADFRRLRHAVGAISELDITPARARIVRLNDTCHLEDAG
jgi:broad specificity phosphatase PhoE